MSKIRVPSCMPVVLIFAMAMCRMVRQRRGRYTIDMEASEARETMSRVLPPQRSLQVKLMQLHLGREPLVTEYANLARELVARTIE